MTKAIFCFIYRLTIILFFSSFISASNYRRLEMASGRFYHKTHSASSKQRAYLRSLAYAADNIDDAQPCKLLIKGRSGVMIRRGRQRTTGVSAMKFSRTAVLTTTVFCNAAYVMPIGQSDGMLSPHMAIAVLACSITAHVVSEDNIDALT